MLPHKLANADGTRKNVVEKKHRGNYGETCRADHNYDFVGAYEGHHSSNERESSRTGFHKL